MNRFFVQISDDLPTIENIQNIRYPSIMDKSNIELILSKFDHDSLFFVVDENTYSYFKNYYTIGYYDECDIVLINDSNIDSFSDSKIKNAYLFVNDESLLFENFKKIYENVDGYLELKMLDLIYYDENVLDDQLNQICGLLEDLEESRPNFIVKQLDGFKMKQKFQEFGDGDYFIGTDANIYYHPKFYYQNQASGVLCGLNEFNDSEINNQFTRPHIICMNCECFYCDRDIYNNKIKTGEFKVPCVNSCKMTTLFSNHSKKLLNSIFKESIFNDFGDLDKVDSFDSEREYQKLMLNDTMTNKLKEIAFNDRKLWR